MGSETFVLRQIFGLLVGRHVSGQFNRGPSLSCGRNQTIGASHFIGITKVSTMGDERLKGSLRVCLGTKIGNGGGLVDQREGREGGVVGRRWK